MRVTKTQLGTINNVKKKSLTKKESIEARIWDKASVVASLSSTCFPIPQIEISNLLEDLATHAHQTYCNNVLDDWRLLPPAPPSTPPPSTITL